MKQEIKDFVPGFDFSKLTEEQKIAVEEVLRCLAEKYANLDLQPLRIKFNLEEKKFFNLDESMFYNLCKKNNIILNVQGHIKFGFSEDEIHYPVIGFTSDIKKLDKMIKDFEIEIIKKTINTKNQIKKIYKNENNR